MLSLAGCSNDYAIEPADSESSTYSTFNGMSALEYSLFAGKQLAVVANQLNGRIVTVSAQKGVSRQSEEEETEFAIKKVEDAKNLFKTTRPAKTYEEQRELTLKTLERVENHLKDYQKDLKEENNVDKYTDIFSSDFNEVTNLSNLYQE